jgi:VCBS repeat-containing protein
MANASPIAVNDAFQINEDGFLTVNAASSVLKNDTDTDDNKLAAAIVSLPDNPLFVFKANGTFSYDTSYHGSLYLDGSGNLVDSASGTFVLTNGFNSLGAGAMVYDTFQYKASDGQSYSNAGTVTITIVGTNDNPVASDDDAGNVVQGQTTTINAVGNDTDVDIYPTADVLTVTALADVNDGYGAGTGTSDGTSPLSIVTDAGGTVTVLDDGSVQYEAAAGFVGIDTVQYTVSDGHGGTDTGLIRFTVLPSNVAPDAANDTYQVGEDATATALGPVLSNDTDANDGTLIGAHLVAGSLTLVDDGSTSFVNTDPGILVDFNADGSFTYNPNGMFNYLKLGETATVQFTYEAFDGHGLKDTATVTLQIQGADDNPTAPARQGNSVYEAGLSSGSGDGSTTIVRTFDFDLSGLDPDGDPLRLVTSGGLGVGTVINGAYGTLQIIDADTVTYTLTSSATHAAVAGHNSSAPITLADLKDSFDLYVTDDVGTFVAGTVNKTGVDVTIFDDIVLLGPDGPNSTVGNDLDSGTVNFLANATGSDTFSFIPGADGSSLQFTGRPANFSLIDGRTVTSTVSADGLTITGTDSNGVAFYKLELIDGTAGDGLWSHKFTLLQGPPSVENPIDFSSVKAGGPQETLTVENIKFDGGFFTPDGTSSPSQIFPMTQALTSSSDDINPNNAGGIGIGNGNIEEGEVLSIDMSLSSARETGASFILQGVGGGISGVVDVLWYATSFSGGTEHLVASGSVTTTNINATKTFDLDGNGTFETGGEKISVSPTSGGAPVAFDRIYVAIDPTDIDSNDTVRINNIATLETQVSGDFVLPFSVRGNEGTVDGDTTQEESFTWTIDGLGTTSTTVGEFDLLV